MAIYKGIKDEYEKAREAHLNKRSDKRFVSIDDARRFEIADQPERRYSAKANLYRHKVFEAFPLEELVPYIDWTPFFHTWELRGSYPKIFDDKYVGVEAKKLYDDAQVLLKKIVKEKLLQANGVIGFWPANSVGDDIELYTDETRKQVLNTHSYPAPAGEKVKGEPYYALVGFYRTKRKRRT